MAAENQDTGVDNHGTDSDYMWASFEQCMDLTAEYKYRLAVEGNNQNLGVGCKLVETDFEGNNCLGVEWVVDKWGPVDMDKLAAEVDSAAA